MISELLKDGTLMAKRDGSIWRCKTRSRTGRVRSISPERTDRAKSDGYRVVNAGKDGRDYRLLAHRIVWIAFNGEIEHGKEINHIDGNRGNNAIENLEVVSKSENLKHSYDHLCRSRNTGIKNGRSKLASHEVAEIRSSKDSSRKLASRFGVSHRMVLNIKAGKAWRDEFPEVAS